MRCRHDTFASRDASGLYANAYVHDTCNSKNNDSTFDELGNRDRPWNTEYKSTQKLFEQLVAHIREYPKVHFKLIRQTP
jgi:hypothetical protein